MGWSLNGIAAALAAGLAASASPAQSLRVPPGWLGAPPVMREHGDWLMVCDNLGTCRAQPRRSGGSLMVRRDAGHDGQLLVVLDGQEPTLESSVPEIGSIAVTGRASALPAGWRLDAGSESAVLDGGTALAFIRAIADSDLLTYRAGGETLEVPLRGLKATLLAMDDAQGRIGTASAFTRPGNRPVASIPPAVETPAITPLAPPSSEELPATFTAQVRRAAAHWLSEEDCPDARIEVDSSWPLTSSEAIVLLACGTGSHSTNYLLVRATIEANPRVRRVVLPPVPRREEEFDEGEDSYTNADWDPATGTLGANAYSCAHTCGENSRWAFDGRDFLLAEHFIYEAGGAEPLYLYRTEIRPGPAPNSP